MSGCARSAGIIALGLAMSIAAARLPVYAQQRAGSSLPALAPPSAPSVPGVKDAEPFVPPIPSVPPAYPGAFRPPAVTLPAATPMFGGSGMPAGAAEAPRIGGKPVWVPMTPLPPETSLGDTVPGDPYATLHVIGQDRSIARRLADRTSRIFGSSAGNRPSPRPVAGDYSGRQSPYDASPTPPPRRRPRPLVVDVPQTPPVESPQISRPAAPDGVFEKPAASEEVAVPPLLHEPNREPRRVSPPAASSDVMEEAHVPRPTAVSTRLAARKQARPSPATETEPEEAPAPPPLRLPEREPRTATRQSLPAPIQVLRSPAEEARPARVELERSRKPVEVDPPAVSVKRAGRVTQTMINDLPLRRPEAAGDPLQADRRDPLGSLPRVPSILADRAILRPAAASGDRLSPARPLVPRVEQAPRRDLRAASSPVTIPADEYDTASRPAVKEQAQFDAVGARPSDSK